MQLTGHERAGTNVAAFLFFLGSGGGCIDLCTTVLFVGSESCCTAVVVICGLVL